MACNKCNNGWIPDPDRGSGWGPYWDTICDCEKGDKWRGCTQAPVSRVKEQEFKQRQMTDTVYSQSPVGDVMEKAMSNGTGFNLEKMEEAGRLMLEAMGEDPTRDGLKDTPKRFAKYYSEIMNGNFKDPFKYVTEFENDGNYNGPVIVKQLPFYTLCEHHLAPFIGHWDVAYKPSDRILGLSKLVRIARVYQKRPQVQERLTEQIAGALYQILRPDYVVVRMKAEHFCMSTRGVRTPGAHTETMSGHGDYPKDIFNA